MRHRPWPGSAVERCSSGKYGEERFRDNSHVTFVIGETAGLELRRSRCLRELRPSACPTKHQAAGLLADRASTLRFFNLLFSQLPSFSPVSCFDLLG